MTRNHTRREFCLIQDDSSHWYVIPAHEKELFEQWVTASLDTRNESYDGPEFDRYRINGGPESLRFVDYWTDEWASEDKSEWLPAECVDCGIAEGPVCQVDADHPGWLCPECYAKYQEK